MKKLSLVITTIAILFIAGFFFVSTRKSDPVEAIVLNSDYVVTEYTGISGYQVQKVLKFAKIGKDGMVTTYIDENKKNGAEYFYISSFKEINPNEIKVYINGLLDLASQDVDGREFVLTKNGSGTYVSEEITH